MITYYTLEEAGKWDEIVQSFKEYDVYYLSSYVKAFELNGDGKALLIFFKNETTRAINVVMLRDIANDSRFFNLIEQQKFFDIVTPYGYGGFLMEGNDIDSLNQEYTSFVKEKGIISEFVRFHPVLDNRKDVSVMYEEVNLGNTVFIDTSNKEIIWNNLTSKNRNMIRKAKKSGLTVFWGRDARLISEFMDIYNATMRRDEATDYYFFDETFYQSILEDLKYHSMWFYTMVEGRIAAIAIFMFCNGQMHYHLSASRKEYQSLAPTNLLLYEAALWATNNGFRSIHLGGGVGCHNDSLYKFKKAFNRTEDKSFYIGRKIFDGETYQKLVEMRSGTIENDSFFPQYRG